MFKVNKKATATVLLILLLLLSSNACFAAISRYISAQAKVTEKNGTALSGSYSVTFRIYSVSSGGTALWTEAQTIAISSGILDAILGQTTAFPTTLTFNTDYWLSIEIGSDGEMSPRIRLTGSPYSLNADTIDAIDSSQLVRNDSDNTISGYLSVGGNLTAGDASSDSFTINAATLSLANASTLDLANSSTTSLNIESGLLNLDTSNSRVGIGTTAPGSTLDVVGALRLSGATSGYVGLSPAAAAGSATYTLPAADGSNGQVLSTNGSGTLSWAASGSSSFTAAGDTGTSQTISNGDTLTLAGGTNGIDTVASDTDTVTLNFNPTEVGTTTWGSGSDFTWTFDAGATDPVIAFSSGNVNFSVSLQIPTGLNPTVDTEGEIAYDRNDDNIRVYDGSQNRAINTVQTVTKAIFDPDGIEATEDAVPILAVEDEWAPFGIKLLNVGIKTDASSTYSVNFEEWTSPTDVAPSTIETVATSSSTEAQDDGTLSDSDIAAGSIIYVDLPTTDIDMLTVWLTYYINTGN